MIYAFEIIASCFLGLLVWWIIEGKDTYLGNK